METETETEPETGTGIATGTGTGTGTETYNTAHQTRKTIELTKTAEASRFPRKRVGPAVWGGRQPQERVM